MTLDPFHHPLWELSDELVQCDQVDDPLSVGIFCCQPLPAGIPELLGKCKWSAHLLQGQHAEVLMTMLWGAADTLLDGSRKLPLIQPVDSRQLLGLIG